MIFVNLLTNLNANKLRNEAVMKLEFITHKGNKDVLMPAGCKEWMEWRVNVLTMYMGEPHKVAAITPSCRNLANPKSAERSLKIYGMVNSSNAIYELRPR